MKNEMIKDRQVTRHKLETACVCVLFSFDVIYSKDLQLLIKMTKAAWLNKKNLFKREIAFWQL